MLKKHRWFLDANIFVDLIVADSIMRKILDTSPGDLISRIFNGLRERGISIVTSKKAFNEVLKVIRHYVSKKEVDIYKELLKNNVEFVDTEEKERWVEKKVKELMINLDRKDIHIIAGVIEAGARWFFTNELALYNVAYRLVCEHQHNMADRGIGSIATGDIASFLDNLVPLNILSHAERIAIEVCIVTDRVFKYAVERCLQCANDECRKHEMEYFEQLIRRLIPLESLLRKISNNTAK
ncbi:MAG: PIN domain-containing protein [Crenarchaeota archaeon]|nr:PIN domain-containing protein [Thermoproteota archaeon]